MFSAILGLAGAGLGFIGQQNAANQSAQLAYAQMAQQERQFQRQHDLQMMNIGMAQDARRDTREWNEYLRDMEQMNRLLQRRERQFDIAEMERLRAQQEEERQYALNRQVQLDRDAARQQAMQLEQMLQNQQLTKDERDFAIQQLQQAQGIARGERDQDLLNFYRERQTRELERQFQVEQYQQMRALAQQERDVEMQRRNRVTGQIDTLRSQLDTAFNELGPLPERPGITREDIDADARRREAIYMADVDRAADRVASVNEADMMRSGVDVGTSATGRRGEITERIAQEYNRARERARDEALRYITGVQGTLFNEYNAAMGERGQALGEVANVYGAGINEMMSMPGLPSAQLQDYLNLQSGVYSRDIQSAGSYGVPVQIGSALYDRGMPGSAMGATLNPPAVTANNIVNRTGVMHPYSPTLESPAPYMQTAAGIGNNMLTARTNMVGNLLERVDRASAGVGGALQDLLGSIGGFGNMLADSGGSQGYGGFQTQSGFNSYMANPILPPPRPPGIGMSSTFWGGGRY